MWLVIQWMYLANVFVSSLSIISRRSEKSERVWRNERDRASIAFSRALLRDREREKTRYEQNRGSGLLARKGRKKKGKRRIFRLTLSSHALFNASLARQR